MANPCLPLRKLPGKVRTFSMLMKRPASKQPPPELPGLMGVSICMRPVALHGRDLQSAVQATYDAQSHAVLEVERAADDRRPLRELHVAGFAEGDGVEAGLGHLRWRRCPWSRLPTMVAGAWEPSLKVTVMVCPELTAVQGDHTWSLVSMRPSEVTTPEPTPVPDRRPTVPVTAGGSPRQGTRSSRSGRGCPGPAPGRCPPQGGASRSNWWSQPDSNWWSRPDSTWWWRWRRWCRCRRDKTVNASAAISTPSRHRNTHRCFCPEVETALSPGNVRPF